MTVRLRAHHLLCVLTYVGKGYNARFVANYDAIAARLSRGEPVEVVDGPDDICAPLRHAPDTHCTNASVAVRDAAARQSLRRVLCYPPYSASRWVLDAERLATLRAAFRHHEIRTACIGCEWHDLCTRVAEAGYPDTRVG